MLPGPGIWATQADLSNLAVFYGLPGSFVDASSVAKVCGRQAEGSALNSPRLLENGQRVGGALVSLSVSSAPSVASVWGLP